ncbi:hypothetical protein ASG35_23570 [Burkholderia sp. Leaf177]|nr:hypothetical protein ASG35_23570 [Burkholderia sp. Leaf177]
MFDLAPRKALGNWRFPHGSLNASGSQKRSASRTGNRACIRLLGSAYAGLSQQSQTFYQTICKRHAG